MLFAIIFNKIYFTGEYLFFSIRINSLQKIIQFYIDIAFIMFRFFSIFSNIYLDLACIHMYVFRIATCNDINLQYHFTTFLTQNMFKCFYTH